MKMSSLQENFMVKNISFVSDGLILKGKLHLPGVSRPPVVIGSHGLHSSKDSPKQSALALACNRLGMAYFRFDHRGCGASQGEFAKVTTLAARCRDLENAVNIITSHAGIGPLVGLFGSSMGGTVSLSVADELAVRTIVTFAAPVCSHIHQMDNAHSTEANSKGIFLDAQKQTFDITQKLSKIKNILIIHGDADKTVPLSHAQEIYRLAGEPKKLIVQQNGDHRMSNKKHQAHFVDTASRWLKSGLVG